MSDYKATTKSAPDNFSARAARGQAYNLAILTAIADARQHDNKYILKQFYRHLEFANMIQNADDKAIVQAIDSPELSKALSGLSDALEAIQGQA